jgi:predicted nucleic acid-binding protein
MSYKYVIDSFAWIEYFFGSKRGESAKPFIEGGEAATPAIVLAELVEKYKREKISFEENLRFILSNTKIVDLSQKIALSAGEINFENKKKIDGWGMADSIVLASAKALGARVVTGDEHFRELDQIMI